ncbi:MAG TPA: hypothetical protein VGG27_19460 [Magnetospirillaceae bacterium]|jgi:hypothetical protein
MTVSADAEASLSVGAKKRIAVKTVWIDPDVLWTTPKKKGGATLIARGTIDIRTNNAAARSHIINMSYPNQIEVQS